MTLPRSSPNVINASGLVLANTNQGTALLFNIDWRGERKWAKNALTFRSPPKCDVIKMRERLVTKFHSITVNGNPLQYSCLGNPRDRGAWWAAVYGVAQSQTRLKQLSRGKQVDFNSNVSPLLSLAWRVKSLQSHQLAWDVLVSEV